MNSQNQVNKFQNISKNKLKENSKTNINKPTGSTTYSKNKKSLEKMLREYQTFCKKYFGESTPIGSMTEERMNKLLEDENSLNVKDLLEEDKQHFLDTLEDNEKNNFNSEEICDKLPKDIFYNENNILGNHKNNKNDYKQRNKIIFNEIKLKEEKKDNEEYNDFEKTENKEDIKEEKVKIIQRKYRNIKYKKKERIYFGYDKEKLNILKIYIDDIDDNGNIKKLDVINYSISENKNKYIIININNLLEAESISKKEILERIESIVDEVVSLFKSDDNYIKENDNKINYEKEEEEEKVLDENGEEYAF